MFGEESWKWLLLQPLAEDAGATRADAGAGDRRAR